MSCSLLVAGCDAEDLPPRRAIALPPEEYLAGLRTPAPAVVLAEYRRQLGGAADPAAPPQAAVDPPADVENMTEADGEDGQHSPVGEAGANRVTESRVPA